MTREEYTLFGARANAKRGNELPHAKLTPTKVKAIRANRKGLTLKELAEIHGLHYRTIEKIHYRETWIHV